MPATWDEAQWVDGFAHISNVFASGRFASIEFGWEAILPDQVSGYVGWRPLVTDPPSEVTNMLVVACTAMQLDKRVVLRITNDGKIAAIETASTIYDQITMRSRRLAEQELKISTLESNSEQHGHVELERRPSEVRFEDLPRLRDAKLGVGPYEPLREEDSSFAHKSQSEENRSS